MKQNFAGQKNIEFVNVEWETEKDIQGKVENIRANLQSNMANTSA
jgi:hypothetical protein